MSRKTRTSSSKKPPKLGILHPIEALGVLPVERGAVRVEKLEERLAPRVPFPHKHDFYQILLITAGSGWHEIDFHRLSASARKIFVMKPGQVHAWQLHRNTRGFVIEFSAESVAQNELLREWLRQSADALTPKPAEWKKLLALAQAMLEEFQAAAGRFERVIQNYLEIFLLHLHRLGHAAPNQKASSEVERFRELVEAHFRREHSVEFYASRLGTSAQALTMRMSRALGKPPRKLIQERLLLEAKRMLAQSGDPISQIGYDLGFEDPNYFARFFRTNAKASPGNFRLAARKDR